MMNDNNFGEQLSLQNNYFDHRWIVLSFMAYMKSFHISCTIGFQRIWFTVQTRGYQIHPGFESSGVWRTLCLSNTKRGKDKARPIILRLTSLWARNLFFAGKNPYDHQPSQVYINTYLREQTHISMLRLVYWWVKNIQSTWTAGLAGESFTCGNMISLMKTQGKLPRLRTCDEKMSSSLCCCDPLVSSSLWVVTIL